MPRRQHRQVLAMALLLLGATGIAALDRAAAPAEDAVGRALAPAQRLFTAAGNHLSAAARGSRDVAELRRELEAVQSVNARLEVQGLKVNDVMRENRTLRRLLDFSEQRVDLDLKGASVVGRKIAEEPGTLVDTIKVDTGSRDGVQPGMAVATDRGLVGLVTRTGASWSDVLLITDASSAVQARVERSRATGMVFGSPSGELRMRFVPQDRGGEPNVQVGDIIFTSGLSEVYPAMVPIGQVVDVYQRDTETHQEAVVRPSVDLDGLEFVLVVVGHTAAEAKRAP